MPHSDSQTFLRELDKKLWTAALKGQFTESAKLEAAIKVSLKGHGYAL